MKFKFKKKILQTVLKVYILVDFLQIFCLLLNNKMFSPKILLNLKIIKILKNETPISRKLFYISVIFPSIFTAFTVIGIPFWYFYLNNL